MSLETLHLVLFLWVGACLVLLVASVTVGFPRAAREHRRAASVRDETVELRRVPEGAVPAPARRAPPQGRAPDLRSGLEKSRRALVGSLERLLRGRAELDADTFSELEALLFGADLGVRTAERLLESARKATSPAEIKTRLQSSALEILRARPSPDVPRRARPHVVLVVGVNGSGKTTSIGKLAARFTQQGDRVLIAASDTFRAA